MKRIIYISLIFLLCVSCEKDVFTGLVETNVYEYGKLFVTSNPAGYKIYIDYKNSGDATPDTVSWLTEGTHKLQLKHDYFWDSTMTITVKKLSTQRIDVDMLKNPKFYGSIYCSTNPSGAKIYLNNQPTSYVTPATVKNIYPGQTKLKFVRSLCRDDSVSLLIKGGDYTELTRTLEDTSKTVSYRSSNSKILSDLCTKVVIDNKNNKWIGTADKGLMKFDGTNWTSYQDVAAIPSSNIQDLLYDKRGRLWVATPKGLVVFDGISWQSITDKLPYENVVALDEDVSGNIWIATFNALVKYDNSSYQIYNSINTNVPLRQLSSVATSKKGDVWVGTSLYGIINFNGKDWVQYTPLTMDVIPKLSPIIGDLIVDNFGVVYAYHLSDESLQVVSALTKFDGWSWSELKLSILFPLQVSSFYLDSDNNVWMAITGGLIKYNPTKTLKVFDSNTYGFFSRDCRAFCLDKNGDGWLTTLGAGIVKIKKSNF